MLEDKCLTGLYCCLNNVNESPIDYNDGANRALRVAQANRIAAASTSIGITHSRMFIIRDFHSSRTNVNHPLRTS